MKKTLITHKDIKKKPGKPLNQFMPSDKIAHELNTFKNINEFKREFVLINQPHEMMPEWPGDNEALVNIFC